MYNLKKQNKIEEAIIAVKVFIHSKLLLTHHLVTLTGDTQCMSIKHNIIVAHILNLDQVCQHYSTLLHVILTCSPDTNINKRTLLSVALVIDPTPIN